MKDSHDQSTQDFGTLEPTFLAFPRHALPRSCYSPEDQRLIERFDAYLREKPYLSEALRRSCK